MAYSVLHAVLFLICFEIASCAYCDSSQIRFPGLQNGGSRLYLKGESFVPSCQTGYRRSHPNGRLVCDENGAWNGHFPPCVVDDCKTPLPSITNGKPQPSLRRDHFSKVEYTCDDHYFPLTASSVRCSFGKWIGTPPICKDSRCVFDDLRHKDGVVSSSTNKTLSGNPLLFHCAPGFGLTGVTPLCTKGTWVEYGISPCKEDDCIIPDFRHGSLMEVEDREVFKWRKLRREHKTVLKKVKKGSSVPAGRKLEIVCDSKYSFEGKGSKSVPTICTTGVWNPKPSCL